MAGNKKRKNASDRWMKVLAAVAAVLLIYCSGTYAATPFFMARPHYNKELAEKVEEIPGVKDFFIDTLQEKTIHGYLLDREDAGKLIIYFGGIAEDAAENMAYFTGLYDNTEALFPDCDIAVIDWPSYGQSTGRATDDAVRNAALCTATGFMDSAEYDEIDIMAYSLGTGPAAYAAGITGCDKLILLAPYSSAADLYNSVTPVFYGPMKYLLGYSMPSTEYAEKVTADTLIVASRSDETVPYESSLELSKHFSICTLETLEGIKHGEIPLAKETAEAVSAFIG